MNETQITSFYVLTKAVVFLIMEKKGKRSWTKTTAKRHPGYRTIKQQVPDELKFFDTFLNDEAFTAVWAPKNPATVDVLNAIVQGAEANDRIGRIYWIKHVYIKGEVNVAESEAQINPFDDIIWRIVLVNDHNTNAIEVVAGQVMDITSSPLLYAFRELARSQRFNILWDHTGTLKRFYVNDGAADKFSHGIERQRFEKYVTFKKPLKVECVGTGGTIASLTGNSIQLIGISDNTTLRLTYQCRIRFFG